MQSDPLETYFPKKEEDDLEFSSGLANKTFNEVYFKFFKDKLVVENIYKLTYQYNGDYTSSRISIYKETFGDAPNFPCDFYSGLLICPYGKPLNGGYNNVVRPYATYAFEYYRLYEIKDGNKVKTKDFMSDEYYEFRKEYHKYLKTTEEYKTEADKLRKMITENDKGMQDFYKTHKKENKYLKQKEAEIRVEKQLDDIMLFVSADYIKTIDIPNKP